MKQLVLIFSILLLSGCASLEWRSIYEDNTDQNKLIIKQFSEHDDELGIQTAGMHFNFTVDDYQYPLKLEQFYHLKYLLGDVNNNFKKMHHIYGITYKSDYYEVVIEFHEDQSLIDVLNLIYKNVKRESPSYIKESVEDYHWEHVNDKRTNMYKLTFKADRKNKSITVMVQEFDKKNDLLENYGKK